MQLPIPNYSYATDFSGGYSLIVKDSIQNSYHLINYNVSYNLDSSIAGLSIVKSVPLNGINFDYDYEIYPTFVPYKNKFITPTDNEIFSINQDGTSSSYQHKNSGYNLGYNYTIMIKSDTVFAFPQAVQDTAKIFYSIDGQDWNQYGYISGEGPYYATVVGNGIYSGGHFSFYKLNIKNGTTTQISMTSATEDCTDQVPIFNATSDKVFCATCDGIYYKNLSDFK